jgi:protein-disulfide isomerase
MVVVLVALAIAAVAAGAAWMTRGARAADGAAQLTEANEQLLPSQVDPLLEARTKGEADAPITVFEVSDFQCPYCRSFWEQTLPALEREYISTGKIRFIFLNLPLVQLHPNAAAAHEFAMCAALQDRFWPVHDLLYQYQGEWARLDDPAPYFRSLADSSQLDRDDLEQCFTTGAVRPIIQQEAEMSFRAGLQSTPSFVIQDALLAGFAPIDTWRPILDSLFAEKDGGQ